MNLKRLVLGTAAGALAVTGAHAADLPVAVEPVEYVRICDAYGTGFFYIPGTETCLRVRGRVRADYNVYIDFDEDDGVADNNGFDDTDDRGYRFRARGYIRMDSRTATEFGLLRTYVDIFATADSLQRGGDAPGIGTVSAADTATVEVDSAFIQFGGLTFGRTATFYGYSGGVYTPEQTLDLGNNTGQVNVLAYTFAFGNGFSASIALEDNTEHREGLASLGSRARVTFVRPGRPNFVGTAFFPGGTDPFGLDQTRYGGAQIPDIVGNVRIDQGWGSAQVMAAGHYVNGIQFGTVVTPDGNAVTVRRTDEKYGFAVGGGVEVNVPFGNGTSVGIQGGYALGALDYIADGPLGSGAVDGVFDRAGNLELGNFFSVAGGFTTSFTPTISLAVGAGYVYMDNEGDFDSQNINAQGFLAYQPVTDFTLGLGVEYTHVDDDSGPEGDVFTAFFRAQRDF
jgi:hypothetical protein